MAAKDKKHDFSLNRTVSSLENIFCFLGVVVCASRVPDSHLLGRCPKSIVEIIYNGITHHVALFKKVNK